MKRLVLIVALAGSLAAGIASCSGGDSTYRVSAIFDSAQGMVPGQLVKIAGARVGTVTEVELIPGSRYRARMVLEIGEEFGPFHADASCRLLPEGLISEKFVDCDPGGSGKPELSVGEDEMAELTDTATPLALQDVLNIFSSPTDERLRILLNELGIATAGRADDINELLRRSNPALTEANEVLTILADQRDRIVDAVAQTDRVLEELAADTDSVADFVVNGAETARLMASSSSELQAGIRELPPLLDAADTGLASLNQAVTDTTPILDELEDSGPALTNFMGFLRDFSDAGRPAVQSLTISAGVGRNAIEPIEKVVASLEDTGEAAPPVVADMADFLTSFRDTDGVNGLLRTAYGLAVGAAARDNLSHYYGAVINLFPICILIPPHILAVPGCDHSYDSPQNGQIPINDPANSAAQRQAFLEWLSIGGPDLVPEWLQSSLPGLINTVATSLGLDPDALPGLGLDPEPSTVGGDSGEAGADGAPGGGGSEPSDNGSSEDGEEAPEVPEDPEDEPLIPETGTPLDDATDPLNDLLDFLLG